MNRQRLWCGAIRPHQPYPPGRLVVVIIILAIIMVAIGPRLGVDINAVATLITALSTVIFVSTVSEGRTST